MKEFDVKFEKGFTAGLRRSEKASRNVEGLVECYNLKPDESGLIPFEPLTDRAISVAVSHPYPQLFIGEKYNILATSSIIYEVSNAWAKTSKLTGLTVGDIWDFADFRDYFVMSNGVKIVYIDLVSDPGVPAYASIASSATFPRCLTYCAYKGQLIGGNVKTSWHSRSTYSLVWSGIGNVDFTPDRENDAGFMNTYRRGNVQRVMRLGDVVMVYSDNSILMLFPSAQMFGMKELQSIGIPCKGAVGGSYDQHVFLDLNDELWRVTTSGQDPKLEKLGYQEFMETLTAVNVVISHDWEKNEFYISDGVKCYLLTDQGLCQVLQLVASAGSLDGASVGTFTTSANAYALVVSDIMDFGLRGMKTLGFLELGIDDTGTVTVAVDYRHSKAAGWSTTGYKTVNKEGAVYVGITAPEFRYRIKSTTYAATNLDYVTAKVKITDKRYYRGVNNAR